MIGSLFAIRGLFSGLKTYIVVGLWFACLFAEKALGFDIPGFDAPSDWVQQAINYGLVITGRAAVAKSSAGSVIERITGAAK